MSVAELRQSISVDDRAGSSKALGSNPGLKCFVFVPVTLSVLVLTHTDRRQDYIQENDFNIKDN